MSRCYESKPSRPGTLLVFLVCGTRSGVNREESSLPRSCPSAELESGGRGNKRRKKKKPAVSGKWEWWTRRRPEAGKHAVLFQQLLKRRRGGKTERRSSAMPVEV